MAKASAKKTKKAAASKAAAAPRIVEGVGIVAVTDDQERASRIEQAMSNAILQAHDEGITDPDEQRKRMLAARDEALKG